MIQPGDEESNQQRYDRDLDTLLREYGIIFFDNAITRESASDFIKKITLLECTWKANDKLDFIACYIYSPGGDANAVLGMCDIVEGTRLPLVGIGVGEVCSGAVSFLSCFPKGSRLAWPNTRFLIHRMEASYEGDAEQFKSQTKEINTINKNFVKLLARRTGQREEKIKRLMTGESFLSADEAKNLGIIDSIVADKGDTHATQQLYKKTT